MALSHAVDWCGTLPHVLLIHLGSNDILGNGVDKYQLKMLSTHMAKEVVNHCPGEVIMWSDILPRTVYFRARSQSAIDNVRKDMNSKVGTLLQSQGHIRVTHPSIRWNNLGLFRTGDPVHLFPAGYDILISDQVGGLGCGKSCSK